MRKIVKISKFNEGELFVKLDNNEYFILYKWGEKSTYTVVSDGLNKSTLSEFKKSCLKFDFCAEKLKQQYLYEQ